MHRLMILTVMCAALLNASGLVLAKNVTRYGHDVSFWRNHVLVVGVVESVEHRHDAQYHISFRVNDCIPSRFAYGSRVEARYEAPPSTDNANFGNLMEGLKPGDRVLALIRPSYGRTSLPNGRGETFAMMPGGAPLYRIKSDDDANVIDTINIFRACSTDNLGERIVAINTLLEGKPTAHVKDFCVFYVAILIGQTESDLANARALLKHAKSK